jgi:thiol-disulfide isomerase/thioredoxin
MTKLHFFLFVLLIGFQFNAKSQGIQFEKGSWAEIKSKAQDQGKYIFVDAFTDWCGPCKWLSKNVFPDPKVGVVFGEKFISYKLDMEKGEGPDFAKEFSVSAYPTLLFFNSSGEMVHKLVGALPADQLIEQANKATDPEQQMFTMKRKFEEGARDREFLLKYVSMLMGANEDASQPSAVYFSLLDKKDWMTEEHFSMIATNHAQLDDEIFQYILQNKSSFIEKLGKESVDAYIETAATSSFGELIQSKDLPKADAMKAKLKNILPEKAAEFSALLDMYFYMGDEKAFDYANTYLSSYCTDWQRLNSMAWNYFETVTDKKLLKAALSWAEKSVSLQKTWFNLDTKANLLYKLNKKKDALKAAEEAIQLAKAGGEDASETEALILKIKGK